MIQDLAKYLSGVAENVGIVNWSINPRYVPPNSLEETYAFHFEGKGNLPHLKERSNKKLIQGITVIIHDDRNEVTIY